MRGSAFSNARKNKKVKIPLVLFLKPMYNKSVNGGFANDINGAVANDINGGFANNSGGADR